MAENIGRMMTLMTRHTAYRHKNHHEDINENWVFHDFIVSDGLSPLPQVVAVKTDGMDDRVAIDIIAVAIAYASEGTASSAAIAMLEGAVVAAASGRPCRNKSADRVELTILNGLID